ncbi:LacI family DNA-binding transcriptional regulator [Tichowtungia aerotolerans]|uniref:Substrate-binding domain-containing protein n=1 Tax=Tichowtungia aerotolerans TaxID=2697043 RepID=A0A6P1M777_9BACT|nr:LacI family DNA-binding transcriptional regulator [Tichowtungia aerotolerans]QHI68038.1 substrate-binding domain-containing protein [Tichowtungia aerotolerans]
MDNIDNKEVTLREIAREMGLSPSTVSRALAGRGGVSPARAKEIQSFAEDMGYRPRPFRRNRTDAVGILVMTDQATSPDDAYHYNLVFEAIRVISGFDWHVHTELMLRSPDAPLPQLVVESRVDGLIVVGYPHEETCKALRQTGIPIVVLDGLASRTGFPCVIPDVGTSTGDAVKKLAEVGHQHFAYITPPTKYPTVQRRVDGFLAAVEELGLPFDPRMLIKVPHSTIHAGQTAVRQILACSNRPTTVFFGTDQLAVGGLIALGRGGIDVPADMSVVSHDNSNLAIESDPPLTSVDLNLSLSLEKAAALLRRQIEGEQFNEPVQIEVSTKVIWRSSCGPAALNGG